MAREEIKLVGSFDDQITKKLQKLNKEIANMSRSFERFNKKLYPVTKSFANMAKSAKEFSNEMNSQRSSIENSARSMREYSRQAGKMTGAMRKITAEREKARRAQGLSRAQARKEGSNGAAASTVVAPTSGGSSRGGARAGQQMAKGFNSGVGSIAIGTAIGNMASQTIIGGLSKLGQLLQAPFRKFQAAFTERIGDEMDDIKSAGGLYALDQDLTSVSGNKRLFNNFNEALRFQEQLNVNMAKSASNLPGTTSQFVDMNRRMTDTIQMIAENDREAFTKLGQRQGADVSMGGNAAVKESLASVGQNLTESLMLFSAGQQGGLPMDLAMQQLLNADDGFKMQSFLNKYRAAFQKNPLLKNFLLRAEKDLLAADAGSAERLGILQDVLDKAMPEAQVNKMRGSLQGLMESVRSGLLDPQGGLFGLSRAVSQFGKDGEYIGDVMKKNVDDSGKYLYQIANNFKSEEVAKSIGIQEKLQKDNLQNSEVTLENLKSLGYTIKEVNGELIATKGQARIVLKQSESSTYLFEQIREILANFGAPLTQIVGFLPTVFDPFTNMMEPLKEIREASIAFFSVFSDAKDGILAQAEVFRKDADANVQGKGTKLGKQAFQRGTLFTIADFLESTGAITEKQFQDVRDKVLGEQSFTADAVDGFDKTGAAIFKELFGSLMNSDLINMISETFGILIGGIITSTFEVIEGIFNALTPDGDGAGTGNRLVDGFVKGFMGQFEKYAQGGSGLEGFMTKVTDLIARVINAAGEILITKVIPMAMKGLIELIASGFKAGPIGALMSTLGIAAIAKVLIKVNAGLMTMAASLQSASKAATSFAVGAGVKGGVNDGSAAFKRGVGLKTLMKGKGGFGKMLGGMGKGLLKNAASRGPMAALFGVASAATSIAAGEDAGKAIGGAAATTIGSVLGGSIGMIFGPVGGMIGSMAGGYIGESIFNSFKSPGQLQAEAAAKMMEAAQVQKEQADRILGKEITQEANRAITDPVKTNLALKATGLMGTDAGTGISVASAALKEALHFANEREITLKEEMARLKGLGMSDENIAKNPAIVKAQAALDQSTEKAKAAEEALSASVALLDPVQLEQFLGALQLPDDALNKMTVEAANAGGALSTFEAIVSKGESTLGTLPNTAETAVGDIAGIFNNSAVTTAGKLDQAGTNFASSVNSMADKINAIKVPTGPTGNVTVPGAGNTYGGHTGGRGLNTMPLGAAIEKERSMMPSGSDLVIANSSETIIPAFDGHMGDGFKGFSFHEMESAAGFDRMKSYTDQIGELADRTAASMASSFGGALGGGSATLNAMEALGNANGLITTSGFRPGDPGFHGANRARDLSNGGGETPEMNKVANIMATQYGQSLTELIYTPLGYSIKNGAKTGLISPDNHYHHIHVAVAEGLAKAAVFNSQQAAEAYEKRMMPAGAEPLKVNLGSMTANSSEMGGVQIGSINISGVDDPKEIAEQVADEILLAMQRSSYTELFSS